MEIKENQGIIIMVEQSVLHPQLLRLTIYTGEKVLTDYKDITKENTDAILTSYNKVEDKNIIDFAVDKIKDLKTGHPTNDWQLFKEPLFLISEGGLKQCWHKESYEELDNPRKKCCDIVDEGLVYIRKVSKEVLDNIKSSGKDEGVDASKVIAIVCSWRLLNDRCERCLEVERKTYETMRGFGWECKGCDNCKEK